MHSSEIAVKRSKPSAAAPLQRQRDRSAAIPTYAADGRRLRNSAEATILRLLALDLVVVERNRRGQIRCAHFRPSGGANPIHKHAHMGQHYSFYRQVGEVRLWEHRQLIARQDVEALYGETRPEELDLFVRAIFRAVPLSVMRQKPPSPKAPGQIVNIAEFKRKRSVGTAQRRPIEFDSERRAA